MERPQSQHLRCNRDFNERSVSVLNRSNGGSIFSVLAAVFSAASADLAALSIAAVANSVAAVVAIVIQYCSKGVVAIVLQQDY